MSSRRTNDPVTEAYVSMLVMKLASFDNLYEPDDLELVHELGRGTFGIATLSRSRVDGEYVVLKKIPLEKLDARGVVRLVSEASLLGDAYIV